MIRRLLLTIAALVLACAARAAEAPATPTYYKPNDVIVILGAVPQEITVFTAAMGNPAKKLLWGIPYYRGKLMGRNAVVAITGKVTANGSTYEVKVRRGIVVSSDLFGVTQQRIEQLRSEFHTDIMEMESAPLGHVCETLGVPYLIVRAGSNVAQEAPNDDYLRLGPIAAREAAKFTLHLVGYL